MLAFLLLETKGIPEDVIIVGMLWFVGGLGSWVTAILEYMASLETDLLHDLTLYRAARLLSLQSLRVLEPIISHMPPL